MSILFYKAMIEDIQHEECCDTEIEVLLAIFERTVKKTAITLAVRADFHLKDFATAKRYGVQDLPCILSEKPFLIKSNGMAFLSMAAKT